MKELVYTTRIAAPPGHVWNTMLSQDTYKQWANAFSPDSQYLGTWEQGETIKFFDPNMGGTLAVIKQLTPHRHIGAEHVATLSKELVPNTDSDISRKWIGATEQYDFDHRDGITTLTVIVQTHPDFAQMFDDGWPKALRKLKALCEKED